MLPRDRDLNFNLRFHSLTLGGHKLAPSLGINKVYPIDSTVSFSLLFRTDHGKQSCSNVALWTGHSELEG